MIRSTGASIACASRTVATVRTLGPPQRADRPLRDSLLIAEPVLTVVLAPRVFERRLLREFPAGHLLVNLRDLPLERGDRLVAGVDVGAVTFQKRGPDGGHFGLHPIGSESLALLDLASKIDEELLLRLDHPAIANRAVTRRYDGCAELLASASVATHAALSPSPM